MPKPNEETEETLPSREAIIKAATFELRRYGYRCDGGEMIKDCWEFDPEAATGQAALFITSVTPYIRFYEGLPSIEICVGYLHPGGGRNGHGVAYRILPLDPIMQSDDEAHLRRRH